MFCCASSRFSFASSACSFCLCSKSLLCLLLRLHHVLLRLLALFLCILRLLLLLMLEIPSVPPSSPSPCSAAPPRAFPLHPPPAPSAYARNPFCASFFAFTMFCCASSRFSFASSACSFCLCSKSFHALGTEAGLSVSSTSEAFACLSFCIFSNPFCASFFAF